MSESEVGRIQRVYTGYRDPGVRARWSQDNPGNRSIARERDALLAAMLGEERFLPLGGRRVLDVGCGSGGILASYLALGAKPEHLVGVDLLPDRLAAARGAHPALTFREANAEALPFDAASFDLVILFTVLTSILDRTMAANVAAEVRRVLTPGGAVVWYDFRVDNPRNPHVRGVGRRRIAELFPGFRLRLRSTSVLPPLARRLGRATPWLYPTLAAVPALRTHYTGLLVKPGVG